MAKAYLLGAKDVATLKDVVRTVMNERRNTTNRPGVIPANGPSSDIYVALTPADGIPRIDIDFAEHAGEDHGEGDKPGYADCDIIQLIPNGEDWILQPVDGRTQRIHNLGDARIPGNQWIIVAKDKYGKWYTTEKHHTTLRWLRLSDKDFDTYGYPAILQEYDTETQTFSDETHGSDQANAWLNFSSEDYEPSQDDVDNETKYLARQENNAPDGEQAFLAEAPSIAAVQAQVRWIRLTSLTVGTYGYVGRLLNYDSATGLFSDAPDISGTGTAAATVWLNFANHFIPTDSDVEIPTIWLARKEENAPDGNKVYVATTDITTAWVIVTDVEPGYYGYEGEIVLSDSETGLFEATGIPVWVQFSSTGYIPFQYDVDTPNVFLARQERLAPDLAPVFRAYLPPEDTRWVRFTSITEGDHGYPGMVLNYDVATETYTDDANGETWIQIQSKQYVPIQNDVDEPVIYLAKRESNAEDGERVYQILDGVTLEVRCENEETGTADDTVFTWYAGRLVSVDEPYGS